MTHTNSSFNPYPTSNPFTSQLYSNNNCGWNGSGFVRCSKDAAVPESKPFTQESKNHWDSVQVPNGEVVPMGCEGRIDSDPRFNQDLFKCPDGTVLDVKTGKVVREERNDDGCWGSSTVSYGTEYSNDWNDKEINDFSTPHDPTMGEMTTDDLEYQRYSEVKNAETKANMSDIQKQLLMDVEMGKFSSKSRLIEENKKCW